MFVRVEGVTNDEGGFVEISSITRDGDGFVIENMPIEQGEIASLQSVEIIGIVENGPSGPPGPKGDKGDKGEPGLSSSELAVINEVLSGIKNDINTTFNTQSPFVTGSTEVFINGLKQTLNSAYTESNNFNIIFTEPIWETAELTINYKILTTAIIT